MREGSKRHGLTLQLRYSRGHEERPATGSAIFVARARRALGPLGGLALRSAPSCHLTWPFPVNDVTMPHLHRIVQALFEPAQVNGPWLIDILWHASLFTAKECVVGFLLGALIGFAIAVALSQSRFLERGFIPYIVASQTIPLLAIAPMVVVGLGTKGVKDWVSVAVLAAYLTFFPVDDQRAARARSRPTRARSS